MRRSSAWPASVSSTRRSASATANGGRVRSTVSIHCLISRSTWPDSTAATTGGSESQSRVSTAACPATTACAIVAASWDSSCASSVRWSQTPRQNAANAACTNLPLGRLEPSEGVGPPFRAQAKACGCLERTRALGIDQRRAAAERRTRGPCGRSLVRDALERGSRCEERACRRRRPRPRHGDRGQVRDQRRGQVLVVVQRGRVREHDRRRRCVEPRGQRPGVRELARGARTRHVAAALPVDRQQRIGLGSPRPRLGRQPRNPGASNDSPAASSTPRMRMRAPGASGSKTWAPAASTSAESASPRVIRGATAVRRTNSARSWAPCPARGVRRRVQRDAVAPAGGIEPAAPCLRELARRRARRHPDARGGAKARRLRIADAVERERQCTEREVAAALLCPHSLQRGPLRRVARQIARSQQCGRLGGRERALARARSATTRRRRAARRQARRRTRCRTGRSRSRPGPLQARAQHVFRHRRHPRASLVEVVDDDADVRVGSRLRGFARPCEGVCQFVTWRRRGIQFPAFDAGRQVAVDPLDRRAGFVPGP